MVFQHVPGPYGSFDTDLLKRWDDVFQLDNLTQIILQAHLIIEQALVRRIEEKLVRREVLHNRKYAALSFAQKTALYIGLYDPDPAMERLLLGFNRLRNLIAHQLVDPATIVYECLPASEGEPVSDPITHVRAAFGSLTFFELRALHGVLRVNAEE